MLWRCRSRYRKKNNWIDLISAVRTERVCKRWSTNDVPFHFANLFCCISSQIEITHGNVARCRCFRFPHIFAAIRELISCVRETRLARYLRERDSKRLNPDDRVFPFRWSFNFANREHTRELNLHERVRAKTNSVRTSPSSSPKNLPRRNSNIH